MDSAPVDSSSRNGRNDDSKISDTIMIQNTYNPF